MDQRYGKVQWGNAPRVRTGKHTWNDPFRWQRQAEKDGDRPFVFCASLADIFDNQVDPQWRADAFEVTLADRLWRVSGDTAAAIKIIVEATRR